jgi:hypothetical protein
MKNRAETFDVPASATPETVPASGTP